MRRRYQSAPLLCSWSYRHFIIVYGLSCCWKRILGPPPPILTFGRLADGSASVFVTCLGHANEIKRPERILEVFLCGRKIKTCDRRAKTASTRNQNKKKVSKRKWNLFDSMEAENQTPAEPDKAEASTSTEGTQESSATNEAETLTRPSSSTKEVQTDPGPSTSSEVRDASTQQSPADKPAARRNYRRRAENSDEESSGDDAAEPESNQVEENQQSSESEDVSLDELRVNQSDDGNEHNSGR